MPRLFTWLALLLLLSGCGYQTGNMMPGGITDVAVELFKSETRPETRYRFAEVTYTRLLTRELIRRAHVRIRHKGQAQAIIRGRIVRMDRLTLVEDRHDQTLEGAMIAQVRVEVVDGRTGEPLMAPFLVTRRESRIVPRGETIPFALSRVLEKVARDTVNRIQAESFFQERLGVLKEHGSGPRGKP